MDTGPVGNKLFDGVVTDKGDLTPVLQAAEATGEEESGDRGSLSERADTSWLMAGTTDLEGGAILIGQRIAGAIDDSGDADVFHFQGVAGESVRIEVNSLSGGLDPAVTLFWEKGFCYGCGLPWYGELGSAGRSSRRNPRCLQHLLCQTG